MLIFVYLRCFLSLTVCVFLVRSCGPAIKDAKNERIFFPGEIASSPVELYSRLPKTCPRLHSNCVPYFLCLDGDDITGLGINKIRPEIGDCFNPDYPDIPCVCCHKSGKPYLVECEPPYKCITQLLCKKEDRLSWKPGRTASCHYDGTYLGVCCNGSPPDILIHCGAKANCATIDDCAGTALAGDGYVDPKTNRVPNCNLEKGGLGICCRGPHIDACPSGSKCLENFFCNGQALSVSSSFAKFDLHDFGHRFYTCTLPEEDSVFTGVCCKNS